MLWGMTKSTLPDRESLWKEGYQAFQPDDWPQNLADNPYRKRHGSAASAWDDGFNVRFHEFVDLIKLE